MSEITDFIEADVRALILQERFQDWILKESIASADLILVNNSFIYRDVKTIKNDKYICLLSDEDGKFQERPKIAIGLRMNAEFKRLSANSGNLPEVIDLDTAVEGELSSLGSLLFILIGKIDDTIALEEEIKHTAFDYMIWKPDLPELVRIEELMILIKETHDEENIWSKIVAHFTDSGQDIPEGLKKAVGDAVEKLQDRAVANLTLPVSGQDMTDSVTDAIIVVLKEQKDQYSQALLRCEGDGSKNSNAFNEILRISYNFASDATTYLKFIMSICDLKPIVFWGTVCEHFILMYEFQKLPWTRTRRKPSLKNYALTIGDARNSAFHNLFPFRKSLDITLSESALQNANLRIFSEHTKKTANQLVYQDKELVNVLIEFTRARERMIPARFWKQNVIVMEATIQLFQKTNDFLKLVRNLI